MNFHMNRTCLRLRGVFHGSNMYIFGGRTNPEPFPHFNDLCCLDVGTLLLEALNERKELKLEASELFEKNPSPRNSMS